MVRMVKVIIILLLSYYFGYYSHLSLYHVPIYRVSLFTVHRVLPPNTVFYIKYVLNVS